MNKADAVFYVGLVCLVVGGILGVMMLVRGNGGSSREQEAKATTYLEVSKSSFRSGESIGFEFVNNNPDRMSWIGIWQAHKAPETSGYDVASVLWTYACGDMDCRIEMESGTLVFNDRTSAEANYNLPTWPLCEGQWVAALMNRNDELLVQSAEFSIVGGNCHGICQKAMTDVSNTHHKVPTPMTPLSRLAFSSNFSPRLQIGPVLWNHMREEFKADLWVWVGNVITEADGEMMDGKRRNYNANKEDAYYNRYGPLKEPKIPVTGTWDEHDSGYNNGGKDYDCYDYSQDEFVYFYDLPNEDPRHPAQGMHQQKGVYSSIPFSIPNSTDPEAVGVHLIMLDVRTFRSPTFDDYGPCEGADSTMLGDDQWAWLQEELEKESEIKVIASGVQVLSPTNQYNIDEEQYCANDHKTFNEAVAAVGENEYMNGSPFENWGQIPQERAKLLQMVQKSINDKKTKRVIFLSGDLKWGELLAKEMPESEEFGSAQKLYEITASGIDEHEQAQSFNANRVRIRSADAAGNGIYQYECQLPFRYNGQEYTDCTMTHTKESAPPERPWCSLVNDADGNHVPGEWGYCQDEGKELIPEEDIGYTYENGCTGSPFHICAAQANYGGIEVDWEEKLILLHVFTPHAETADAAIVRIPF